MIRRLTPEQETTLPIIRDKWLRIGLSTERIDRQAAEAYGHRLLAFLGRADGPVIVSEGPLASYLICRWWQSVMESGEKSVEQSVRQRVLESVLQSVLQSVEKNVWQSVEKGVGENVEKNVREGVGERVWRSVWQNVGESVMQSVEQSGEKGVQQIVRQRIAQDVEQRTWQRVRQSIAQSITQSVAQGVGQSVALSVWAGAEQPVQQSVWQNVWQSVKHSIKQRIAQGVEQSIGQNVGQSASASIWMGVEDRVRQSVEQRVQQSVEQGAGLSVWESVWQGVEKNVEKSVREGVGENVGRSVGENVGRSVWPYMDGQFWASWCAFAEAHAQWCELPDWSLIRDQAFFGGVWPMDGMCVVSDRPTHLHRADDQLHCEDGPAVAYADGTQVWAIRGVIVDEQVVMRPETQTLDDIGREPNAEVQRLRIERYGWPRYLKAINAEVVDERDDAVGATHEALMRGDGKAVLVCACPSTGRVYALEVDPACASVEQAQNFLNGGRTRRLVGAS